MLGVVTYSHGRYLNPRSDKILGLGFMHRVLPPVLDPKSTIFFPFGHSIPYGSNEHQTLGLVLLLCSLVLPVLVSYYSNLRQIASLVISYLVYVSFGIQETMHPVIYTWLFLEYSPPFLPHFEVVYDPLVLILSSLELAPLNFDSISVGSDRHGVQNCSYYQLQMIFCLKIILVVFLFASLPDGHVVNPPLGVWLIIMYYTWTCLLALSTVMTMC